VQDGEMTDRASDITPEALQGVGELLNLAVRLGFAITLEPDDDGWQIGYMRGMGGGDLSTAYDLATAVEAAKRPLIDLAEQMGRNRRD
jgi:hypothetical protein